MLVTDFPVWEDCPFRNRVPDNLEIRRGMNEGNHVLVFWDPEHEIHVDVPYGKFVNKHGRITRLTPILEQLAWAVAYKQSGGKFSPVAIH